MADRIHSDKSKLFRVGLTVFTFLFLSSALSSYHIDYVHALSGVSCPSGNTSCNPFGSIQPVQPESSSERSFETKNATTQNDLLGQIWAYEGRDFAARYQDGDSYNDYYIVNVWESQNIGPGWAPDYDGLLRSGHWTGSVNVSVGEGTVITNSLFGQFSYPQPPTNHTTDTSIPIHLGIDEHGIQFGLTYTINIGGNWMLTRIMEHQVDWNMTLDRVSAPGDTSPSWGVTFGVIVPEGHPLTINATIAAMFVTNRVFNQDFQQLITSSTGRWLGADAAPRITTPLFPGSIVLGDTATIRVGSSNLNNSAQWQAITVGFPNVTDPTRIQYQTDSNTLTGAVYPAGVETRGCYGLCKLGLSYPLFVANATPWLSGEAHYVTLNVKPETAGTFTFYVKSVAGLFRLNGTAGASDPSESCSPGVQDEQNECVYSYSVIVNKHQTSTTVSCIPSIDTVGEAATCTVMVIDTSANPTTPQGTVTFSYTGRAGTFSSTTCILMNGSCSVGFIPAASETATITGSYGGDSIHSSKAGSLTITAKYSTPPTNDSNYMILGLGAGITSITGAAAYVFYRVGRRKKISSP